MSQSVPPPREKEKSDMQFPETRLQSGGMSIFGNAFYLNDGRGGFEEASDRTGAEIYWPWGVSVGDLNADGFDDVFMAASMNYPFRYGVNSVLLNDGGERFVDSEFVLGVEPRRDGQAAVPWFEVECTPDPDVTGEGRPAVVELCLTADRLEVWSIKGTRSSVIFDLDDDGDLDIVTNDFGSEPMVLVSDLSESRPIRFLKVHLIGTESNRDGLGARVTVTTATGSQTKVMDGVSGYLSHSVFPLYFGLRDAEAVERVEVVWPSGRRQAIRDGITVNSTLEVVEG
jgi:hypothetical protein